MGEIVALGFMSAIQLLLYPIVLRAFGITSWVFLWVFANTVACVIAFLAAVLR